MFCPKCGSQNPDVGKFCRNCGIEFTAAAAIVGGKAPEQLCGDETTGDCEGAYGKLFTGAAFIVVAIVLAFSRTGEGWWFWLLIPGFVTVGQGIARLASNRTDRFTRLTDAPARQQISSPHRVGLPSPQTEFATVESRYRTGDLAPSSVTETTTRHLRLSDEHEGETEMLPRR